MQLKVELKRIKGVFNKEYMELSTQKFTDMKTLITLLTICLTSITLSAQPIKITGHVHDTQHSPLHGATVVLYDAENDALLGEIMTDAFGNFQFDDVAAGTYAIRLFHDGFEIEKEEDIHLVENRATKHINFYMTPEVNQSFAAADGFDELDY